MKNGPVAQKAKNNTRRDKKNVGPVAEKAKKKKRQNKRKITELMNGTNL
jgi:hypothetical protein